MFSFYQIKTWFADNIFSRVLKNAGFLLSGKVATGLLGLAYLSLAAHGLGLKNFGILILIQTYVQVVAGLTTFHSWQAVIRYGAISIESKNQDSFFKLISFTTFLDVCGVVIGAFSAWFLAPLVGPFLGWDKEIISIVQPYSMLILFTIVATPTGLLRLFNRFDVLAWQVIITPALRLIGVVIAVIVNSPIWGYLVAWFIAGAIGGLSLVFLGWREGIRQGSLSQISWSIKKITTCHPGIWGFCFASNFHSSLQLVTGHLSTLAVGFMTNPSDAGMFKVAREVATSLTKPSELLTQSIYPEFARMCSSGDWKSFKYLIWRISLTAGAMGLLILIIMVSFGEIFLEFFFGIEFVGAFSLLILLVVAASITISGFGFDPALYAMGMPSVPLRVNAIVVICLYLPLLVGLVKAFGLIGAGTAILVAAILTVSVLGIWTKKELAKQTSQR